MSNNMMTPVFGRDEIVRQIFDRLFGNRKQGPQSCALIGPAYIGKSKILRTIMTPEVLRKYDFQTSNITLVYLDCADVQLTKEDALRSLNQCAMKCKELKKTDYEKVLSDSISLAELRDVFDSILKDLESKNISLVFVLDHFDLFLSLFSAEDITFLREMFDTKQHALVIGIPKPLRKLTPHKIDTSKFDLIFTSINVKCFTMEQSRVLVVASCKEAGISVPDNELDIIISKCGCHPYFLDVYCSVYIEIMKTALEVNFVEINQRVTSNLKNDFLRLWQDLGDGLQSVLSDLSRGYLKESSTENIEALHILEFDYGILYRTKEGHYEIQGELLRDFVITQTELIAKLSRTDYYRAGVKALNELLQGQYLGTDPLIYYKEAFNELSRDEPDFDGAIALIQMAFEQFIDAMVKRSEPRMQKLFRGETIDEMILFLEEAIEIDTHTISFLRGYWNILKSKNLGEYPSMKLHNSIFRFYLLSATVQLLVNTGYRNLIIQNQNAFDSEYEITESLSETDHSVVVKARHKIIRTRYVVAKSVLTKGFNSTAIATLKERLLREAEIIAGLDHPNIGRVHHIIVEPLTVIMQWIEGDSLQDTGDDLSEHDIVIIGCKLLNALSVIHQSGVVHRDVKPSNIILRGKDDPVLVDFDIARSARQATITGVDNKLPKYVGSPDYSAPEQWRNSDGVNEKADIFSLGAVLYELFTNKLPYETNELKPDQHFERLKERNVEPKLYYIMSQMLLEDPALRPDAETVEQMLRDYLEQIS